MTTVDVWLIDTRVPEAVERELAALLDDAERARAASARTGPERRRYVVSHGLARRITGSALGRDPAAVVWSRGPNGKPAVEGVQVNLSHSGELAMFAVSGARPVGVDLQHLVPGLDFAAMAARFFAPHERPATRPGFARLWARKEAVIKAADGRLTKGMAIAHDDDVVDYPGAGPFRVCDLPAPDGYAAAVALAGAAGYRAQVRWASPR